MELADRVVIVTGGETGSERPCAAGLPQGGHG